MLNKKSDICLVNCWRHWNPFIKWVIFHLSSGINSDKIPGWLPKVGNNKESRISWQDVAIWPRLLVCRLARKTLIYGTKKNSHSEPEMLFCYQNCSGLLVRKNCSSDREKLLKFEAEGREFAKNFEVTRTIYSNSERSEQFLVTECFFNLFLEVSQI